MAYVVKSAVRGLLRNLRVSGDFFKALDKKVAAMVKEAAARAKANGRKTLRKYDL